MLQPHVRFSSVSLRMECHLAHDRTPWVVRAFIHSLLQSLLQQWHQQLHKRNATSSVPTATGWILTSSRTL
jgi:hypothetical protein